MPHKMRLNFALFYVNFCFFFSVPTLNKPYAIYELNII
ncbi:hypothetical protein CSUNSWCD_1815 [Campylobacter showae CSUNSWCD]|uniref:Uncharacterized protein n=1 Tax=Campylobacter showae CSUNSWCD TaxID=1244083 RepID=M5IQF6_9BACT|nr:hypothetical protein CSUNSWCD_1815 [Campylobacter showae CSUNSWCD]